MARSRTSILLIIVCVFIFCNSNVAQRDGKGFMDIFNIVRLNPNNRLAIGLQITFPISTFMPNLGILGRHSRSYFSQATHNLWSLKPSSSSSEISSCPSRGISVEDYLQLLLIDEEPCQELFICEMSADPGRFMPLSEILLKKLSFDKKIIQQSSGLINSTEYNFYQAAIVGADVEQECQNTYWKCPVDVTSMINVNLLWGFQMLTKFLNIKFIGETQANVLDQ